MVRTAGGWTAGGGAGQCSDPLLSSRSHITAQCQVHQQTRRNQAKAAHSLLKDHALLDSEATEPSV